MRSVLLVIVALGSMLVCPELECAPGVVAGLMLVPAVQFASPPPTPVWAEAVDPATFSVLSELYVALAAGGAVAADIHGHRAYLTGFNSSGAAVAVIDTIMNRIEAVVATDPGYSVRSLATDPVRARLYAASDYPQPHIAVVDTGALTPLPPIALPQGLPADEGISTPLVTPDGTRLFVIVANVLIAVGLPDGQIVASVALDFTPSSLAVNQDRSELYVGDYYGQGVFVLDADSLASKRNLGGFTSVYAVAVRSTDGALLVESDQDDDYTRTRLDVVEVETGARLATSTGSGYNLVVGIGGQQVYRLRQGDYSAYSAGAPFAETSESLVVLDALSLNPLGAIALDTRAPDDPLRQGFAIRTGFAANPAAATPKVSLAVEYFNAALGHYFLTSFPAEIAGLDSGLIFGWQRTGAALPVYAERADGPQGIVPVCRFYGLPQKGLDSHFYSASALECMQVQQAFGDSWILETSEAFDVYPADVATGACLFGTVPVYRVYNNRPDANHRYTTSLALRDSMVQAGWVAEGYGPDAIAFCVPR